MTSHAINGPNVQSPTISLWVWFTGATALLEGQGLCYDANRGTATAVDGKRYNMVELPSITNNRHFSGVAARAYAASTGGQLIEVYAPGSVCTILSKVSNTIDTGRTTCIAGGTYAGYFERAGFGGKGSAVPLQTVDRSSTVGKCQALLEDGEQSGLIEVVQLEAADTAMTFMVGGVTILIGVGLTADATFTLADGTLPGEKKGFVVLDTAITTSDAVVTVTSGIMGNGHATGTGTLATITLNAANEYAYLTWSGLSATGVWAVESAAGATLA